MFTIYILWVSTWCHAAKGSDLSIQPMNDFNSLLFFITPHADKHATTL